MMKNQKTFIFQPLAYVMNQEDITAKSSFTRNKIKNNGTISGKVADRLADRLKG